MRSAYLLASFFALAASTSAAADFFSPQERQTAKPAPVVYNEIHYGRRIGGTRYVGLQQEGRTYLRFVAQPVKTGPQPMRRDRHEIRAYRLTDCLPGRRCEMARVSQTSHEVTDLAYYGFGGRSISTSFTRPHGPLKLLGVNPVLVPSEVNFLDMLCYLGHEETRCETRDEHILVLEVKAVEDGKYDFTLHKRREDDHDAENLMHYVHLILSIDHDSFGGPVQRPQPKFRMIKSD